MNQKPLFLAVTLAALLVIGGAFWMMQKRQVAVNQPVVADPVAEPYVQSELLLERAAVVKIEDLFDGVYDLEPLDFSTWVAYRNEAAGFESKIPPTWFCGGVALAPELPTSLVCLEKEEQENYYHGKYNKNNLVMYNRLGSNTETLREQIMYEKQQLGKKIYKVKIGDRIVIQITDANYSRIIDPLRRWDLVRFPEMDTATFDTLVFNSRFIQ
ncbi:MAG: hypothetical protein WAT81_04765 [Candidatus Moraniibacteriota bacterium]